MIKQEKMWLTAVLTLSTGALFGRLLGFVREILLVETYGLTAKADTISLLMTWPETLAGFLLAGSSASWLIPKLSSAKSNEELVKNLFLLRTSVLAASIVIGLIGFLFAEYLFQILYAGGSASQLDITYFRIMSVFVIFISLFSVDNAYLQARGFFTPTSLSTPLLNLGIIFTIYLSAESGLLNYVLFLAIFYALRWVVVSRIVSKSMALDSLSYLKVVLGNKRFYQFLLFSSAAAFLSTSFPLVLKSLASLGGDGKYVSVGLSLKFFEVPAYILVSSMNLVFASNYSTSVDERDKRENLLASELVTTCLISTCITCATVLFIDLIIQQDSLYQLELVGKYSEPLTFFYYLILAMPFFSIFNSLVIHFFACERSTIIILVSSISLLFSCIIWFFLRSISLDIEIMIGVTHLLFFLMASLGLYLFAKNQIFFQFIDPICYFVTTLLLIFIIASLSGLAGVFTLLIGIVLSALSFFVLVLKRKSLVIFYES